MKTKRTPATKLGNNTRRILAKIGLSEHIIESIADDEADFEILDGQLIVLYEVSLNLPLI